MTTFEDYLEYNVTDALLFCQYVCLQVDHANLKQSNSSSVFTPRQGIRTKRFVWFCLSVTKIQCCCFFCLCLCQWSVKGLDIWLRTFAVLLPAWGPAAVGAGNFSPCDQRPDLPCCFFVPLWSALPFPIAPIRAQSTQAWVITLWSKWLLYQSFAHLVGPTHTVTPDCVHFFTGLTSKKILLTLFQILQTVTSSCCV